MRDMLLKIVDEARNRLEHLREPVLRELAEQTLADTRIQLKTIAAGIKQVIAEDDDLDRKAKLVRSLIGAGPVLTSNLLAYMPELGSTGRREVARLSGTAPADRQSGKSRRHARIQGGRDRLRPVLYMVALTAMRCNPTIAAFANELTAAGKAKRLVVAACARKIIVILNAMLRDQTPWRYPKNA